MLGCDLELSADVVANELFEKAFIAVAKQIVEAYSRTDKHLFDLWKSFYAFDKLDVFGMVGNKIFAGRGG